MRTFWRITRLLGDYKLVTAAGFVLAFVQMGLGLVVPRITQLTIDRALLGGETDLLVWYYGLGLLGVGVVRFIVGVTRRWVSSKANLGSQNACDRSRSWIVRHDWVWGVPASKAS